MIKSETVLRKEFTDRLTLFIMTMVFSRGERGRSVLTNLWSSYTISTSLLKIFFYQKAEAFSIPRWFSDGGRGRVHSKCFSLYVSWWQHFKFITGKIYKFKSKIVEFFWLFFVSLSVFIYGWKSIINIGPVRFEKFISKFGRTMTKI